VNNDKLEQIRSRIVALDAIPTIPAVIQPLLAMLQMPFDEVDMNKVRDLISYDKTLAALCLRVANSPLFGRREVQTVSEALIALGLKRVQSIVLSCSLAKVVPPEKWAMDAVAFWRHSLGCALISRKVANLIGYQDAEKAYLAGLLHDLGILVNSLVCTEEYRACLKYAADGCISIDKAEKEQLGFTHCESGKILSEHWRIPDELGEVIEFHHGIEHAKTAAPLVSLVHLSDLLCRVRDLGYGYYEILGVDFAGDEAWAVLVKHYPRLQDMDLARLSLDIEAGMDEVVTLVDTVFGRQA